MQAVIDFVKQAVSSNFELMTTFPRKVYGPADFGKTLKELRKSLNKPLRLSLFLPVSSSFSCCCCCCYCCRAGSLMRLHLQGSVNNNSIVV